MRNPFLQGPDPAELDSLQLQELVRDYPELLPLLRGVGGGLRESAIRPLPASVRDALGEELESVLMWRRRGGE